MLNLPPCHPLGPRRCHPLGDRITHSSYPNVHHPRLRVTPQAADRVEGYDQLALKHAGEVMQGILHAIGREAHRLR